MDDLTLWDRPLSAAEVVEVYNQGRSYVPQITTESLNTMRVYNAFSQQFTADFTVSNWSAINLPIGLTLSSGGLLSGTPTYQSTGTMTVTASGGGTTVQKNLSWTVGPAVSPVPVNHITANGKGKTTHSGWATPSLTWSLVSGKNMMFSSTAGYLRFLTEGIGRVRATSTTNDSRAIRIVSSVKGVLATSGTSTSNSVTSQELTFVPDEQVSIEINGYSGTTNDRFNLYVEP